MRTRSKRNNANSPQIILLLVCSFFAAWNDAAFADFVVSAAKGCPGVHAYKPANEKIYGYEVWSFSMEADVTVSVVSRPSLDAILFEVVDSPQEADLVLIDEYPRADMYVCKSSCATCGFKSISVINGITSSTDIVVAVTNGQIKPDYKIYVSGDTFSLEQAVSIFPAIWFLNRK